MSDGDATEDAPEDAGGGAPKEKIPRASGCLLALTPVTTPGCAGCLSLVFLVTTVVTVWTAFLLDPNNVPWRHSMSPLRVALVLLLVVVIPLVVKKTVEWWMEGEKARFPDVDYAWQAGLQALTANGITLTSAPLYVVVGSSGEQQEKALLAAAGLPLRVEGVPEGPAPLHWYANSEGIYLFCSDASWTSALAALREELTAEALSKGISTGDISMVPSVIPDIVRTTAAPAAAYVSPSVQPLPTLPAPLPAPKAISDSNPIGGTMMLDASMLRQLTGQPALPNLESPAGPSASDITFGGAAPAAPSPPQDVVMYTTSYERSELETPVGIEPVLVAPQYSAACLQQLRYVGNLLRKARTPVCPMNGVLALIPFESIHSTAAEMDEQQQALRADLATLQFSTQLRAPVTALIVGLERERGFRELVRRVGKERAASQRFGRKFDVRAFPTKEELAALSLHVCGAFEDWAYALFREENALTRPGNMRLYELLSKVRCGWKTRLSELLAGGFGCETTPSARRDSLLFSGCYLAATGDTPDRQAFAKGVIDKLKEEQELVEWSREAVLGNRRQATMANVGMLATLFLFFSLIVMFLLGRLK
ncbi:MAG: hypothetical protein K8U03_21665 [Planctomycetia bacterium]|nr:hypothetical protein [Planctomycetia bacterium]